MAAVRGDRRPPTGSPTTAFRQMCSDLIRRERSRRAKAVVANMTTWTSLLVVLAWVRLRWMAAWLGDTNLTAGGPRPCGGALCCCPGVIVILSVVTKRE